MVEEIVAVMRHAAPDRHGYRLRDHPRAVAPRLRIQEALKLAEPDLDPRRGSVLVRHEKASVVR
jgi:hypothetical protein